MLYIIAALLLLTAVFLINRRPDHFRTTRSAVIPAAPAVVFEQVNNLRNGNQWSPWAKLDPQAIQTYEGPEAGEGAIYKWSGNKTGQGIMTIIESKPNELVRFRMEFLKPFKAVNTAEFALEPQGEHTKLSWSMYGPNNFMAKAIGLFINCDKMCGDQFERGLENLKEFLARG